APGTTLGAATPVRVGAQVGDGEAPPAEEAEPEEDANSTPDDAMSAKMVEDAVAYIRGLANLHGRNAEWAEKAVREAASLSASEAEQENVVDLVVGDLDELLEAIDGRSVAMERG